MAACHFKSPFNGANGDPKSTVDEKQENLPRWQLLGQFKFSGQQLTEIIAAVERHIGHNTSFDSDADNDGKVHDDIDNPVCAGAGRICKRESSNKKQQCETNDKIRKFITSTTSYVLKVSGGI